jgi:hypothetical protein
MTNKENIIITGYYNQKNIADDLFLNVVIKLFNSNDNYFIKIVPIDIIQKNIKTIGDTTTSIILFGGEVLNNYFLECLMKIKEYNQHIKLYGIGVGIGTTINEIKELKHMLLSFQYIICRHLTEYKILKYLFPILKVDYIQDITFLYDIKGYHNMVSSNIIGFFLSQSKFYGLSKDNKLIYMINIINTIKHIINSGYSIYLFSTCHNNIETENDVFLNIYIYNLFNSVEQKKIKVITNDTFNKDILNIKYAICERYYSHILCLIYNIPFLSFANTNKVKYLLNDLNLSNLLHNNYDTNILNKLTKINKNELKNIYKSTYKSIQKIYNKLNNCTIEDLWKYCPQYKTNLYITNLYKTNLYNGYLEIIKENNIYTRQRIYAYEF